MKKIRQIIALSTLFICLIVVSCSKDDMEADTWDHRLVGTWKLETELYYVNISDEHTYFEDVLKQMIREDNLMNQYTFPDTIQFDKNGFYSQTGYLMREEILESRYDFFPPFHVKDNLLKVEPWAFESTFGGKTAGYDISADGELLEITIENTGDYEFLRLHLEQSGEYDDAVRDLEIQDVRITQIYRKLLKFPLEEE